MSYISIEKVAEICSKCAEDMKERNILEINKDFFLSKMQNSILKSLKKIANELDEKGLHEEADIVDNIIQEAKKKEWPKIDLKEGRFTKWCKSHGFSGPSKACADKAFKSNDASVRGMASFYTNTTLKKKKK